MRAGGNGDLWGAGETLNAENAEVSQRSRNNFANIAMLLLNPAHRLSMAAINSSPNGVTFTVKVHPRAKKNAITGEVGDALKVSLTAPPADGKANQACIDFFAKLLKVPRSSVTIAAGLTSRNKVIRVAGLSVEEVRARLAG